MTWHLTKQSAAEVKQLLKGMPAEEHRAAESAISFTDKGGQVDITQPAGAELFKRFAAQDKAERLP